jgi:flagellar biosynthesis protein FliQ
MKTAIRWVIVMGFVMGVAYLSLKLDLTTDNEGELAWIPFLIAVLVAMTIGGQVDRYLKKRLGEG